MTNSLLSFGEFATAVGVCNITELKHMLIVAIAIVVSNLILVPFAKIVVKLIKTLWNKVITYIKSKQKTPENDGEIADILLEQLKQTQDELFEKVVAKVLPQLKNEEVKQEETKPVVEQKIKTDIDNNAIIVDDIKNEEKEYKNGSEQSTTTTAEQPCNQPTGEIVY